MFPILLMATLAQSVTITASPAQAGVSPLPGSAMWTVYVCSDVDTRIAGARIEAVLTPQIQITPKTLAISLITRRSMERWQSRVIRIGGVLLAGATAVTGSGLVTATPKLIAALAMATTVAPEAAARLKSSLPVFDSATLIDSAEWLEIPAGGCAVRHVITRKTKSMTAIRIEMPIPRVMPRATPSSIPASFGGFV